jgi:hypothetical protein
MRTSIQYAALLAVSLTVTPLCAHPANNKFPDEQSIAALEAKATQAQPREQCFLYSELVQQMTELSVRQYASGDIAKAQGLLKRIQGLASKIHLSVARNDKRLKNAEIMLSNTSFRLKEMLNASDYEDRPLVQQTLSTVNNAQDEAMLQVFQQ